MNRRSFFALLAGLFGARKLPAARKLYEFHVPDTADPPGRLKPGETYTIAGVYAVNPPAFYPLEYVPEWRSIWPRAGS